MTLTPQPLPLQFSGGIETKQDAKQVPLVKLLDLQNATFVKATTLAKRNGYRALSKLIDPTGAEYADPRGMAARGEELLVFTDGRCYSYRDSIDRWSDAGEVSAVIGTDQTIARTGTAQSMPDLATNGGVRVVAWEDSRGGVWCSVLEAETNRVLVADVQLDALGTRPRCIAVGTVLHILWARASASRIYCALVNPAMASATPVGTILVDDLYSVNPAFDACTMGGTVYSAGDVPGVIAWATALGWRVGYVHPSGVLGSPVNGLPSAASYTDGVSGGIAVSFDKTNQALLGVVLTDAAASTRAYLLARAALGTSSSVVVAAGAGGTRVACEFDASGLWWATDDGSVVRCGEVSLAAAITVAARTLRGHTLASRAFYDSGQVYAAIVHGVKYFPYVAVARLSGTTFGGANRTTIVARMLPGDTLGTLARGHVPSAASVDPDASGLSRQHELALSYRIQLAVAPAVAASDQFSEAGIRRQVLDFDHAHAYQTAQLGRGLYLAGALPQHYDGSTWAEHGFHAAPDVASGAPSIATPSGAGGSMPAGTYGYKFCYEAVDANGEIHQGAVGVSVNAVVPGAGTGSVSLALPTCRLTARKNVRIGVFRSPVGQTGDPDSIPYYRVTSLDPTVTAGNNRFVANDPTVDTVTFVDGLTDADLLLREPLYTNGGILSNDPSPMTGAVIAGGKSRLFWTDPSNPNLVRYSQLLGTITAVEAPAAFSQPVDPYGGPITAIGVMDGAVYPFKETAIYIFGGPGPQPDPNIQPDTNAFTPAELLTGDVGCIAPGSICSSPAGITFQSAKGIKLLARDRTIKDIGNSASAYNGQTIVRATLLPDRTQVLFLTDDGRTLLWDYERDQWSTYTNHEGLDAIVRDGTYHYLRADGRVFVETPDEYRDDNSHIPMLIETAHVKAAGYLQGWQRILWAYFIGERKSSHRLAVRFRCDYESAWSPPFLLDVDADFNPALYGAGAYGSGVYGGPGGATTVYQRRIHLNRRCQSIQFRIEDVEGTAEFGASYELSELLLIGGVVGTSFKPGPARST